MLLEQFRAVLLAVQQRAALLPAAVVHGDPWPGNAIQTAQDQVTLIDWENAGLGVPLLDLGYCLLECHLDAGLPTGQPAAWQIQPDEDRIAALADNLRRMGAQVEERPDGLRVGGRSAGRLHGAEIDPRGDHRMAMAFAVAALGAEGDTVIRDAECAAVSFPAFFATLDHLVDR